MNILFLKAVETKINHHDTSSWSRNSSSLASSDKPAAAAFFLAASSYKKSVPVKIIDSKSNKIENVDPLNHQFLSIGVTVISFTTKDFCYLFRFRASTETIFPKNDNYVDEMDISAKIAYYSIYKMPHSRYQITLQNLFILPSIF